MSPKRQPCARARQQAGKDYDYYIGYRKRSKMVPPISSSYFREKIFLENDYEIIL